jgi:acyl-CoA hydrolase
MRGVLPGKRVAESAVVMSQLMLPSDANPWGNVHGGSIMKLVDSAAGVVATRHCRTRVVTARIDEMSFLAPVSIGDVVTLKASVNDTGHTSLEVGVRVEAEELRTGRVWHVGSAHLVFVSLDDVGRPTPVPPLIAETPEEVSRQQAARARRARRQRERPAGAAP